MLFFVYSIVIFKYIIYGSSVFFTGELLASADVLDILALRFLMSAAVFVLLGGLRVIRLDFRGKDMRSLALSALFEPVLYFVFETLGIAHTSNLTAGILLALEPVFVAILQTVILREHTNRAQRVCLAAGVIGVVIVVCFTERGGVDTPLGISSMLLAVFSGAFFTLFSRKSSAQFSAMEVTSFSAVAGAVAFNAANVVRHLACGTMHTYFQPYLSAKNLIGFVFLAIGSTIIATGLNNFALSKIQAARVVSFCGLSTLVTMAEGVLLRHETLYWYHIVGALLIIGGVIGVNRFAASKIEELPKDAPVRAPRKAG